MTADERIARVLSMRCDDDVNEHVSALTLLAVRHPEVFDGIWADIEDQRRIRAGREARDGG